MHDTWVRRGTDWRLHRSVEVSNKTWLNGKLVAATAAAPPLLPAQRDAIVAELTARAIPFKTVAAGSGFEDLAVLDAIVGDGQRPLAVAGYPAPLAAAYAGSPASPRAVGWRGCTASLRSGKLFQAGSTGSRPGRGA
jgi:hypothetical protein